MKEYNDFLNEVLLEDKEIKKEIDLLELKYLLIETLIEYRKSNKLTQTQFAEKINVKQQMISRFEKGEVDPRLSFISKILFGMNKNVVISNKEYVESTEKITIQERKLVKFPNSYSFNNFDEAI